MQAILEAYERYLRTSRGLSPATVRNYVADLAPFDEYLQHQGLSLEEDSGQQTLTAFVTREGDAHTPREYRYLVRDYVAWMLERRKIRSGTRAGQHGHQRGSVVRCLAALRSFMRYAIRQGLAPDAPLWASRSTLMRRFTPKVSRLLPDTLSAIEAVRLMEAPKAKKSGDSLQRALRLRDEALLELLYGGGLRVSEAVGLNVDQVAVEEGHARVWGKGSKARQVPLGTPALHAIRAYETEGRPLLAKPQSENALFLNRGGGRLSIRSVEELVRRYSVAAGLRADVHPHTLRHSYATHLLDGGADLRIVQELLGHSTPSATQVYTHVSQNEARRVYLAAHPLAKAKDKPLSRTG